MRYAADASQKAANAIRSRADARQPSIGIILGSGLGGLANKISDAVRIPFGDIPGFPEATVAGHEGTVVLGSLGGREVVALGAGEAVLVVGGHDQREPLERQRPRGASGPSSGQEQLALGQGAVQERLVSRVQFVRLVQQRSAVTTA